MDTRKWWILFLLILGLGAFLWVAQLTERCSLPSAGDEEETFFQPRFFPPPGGYEHLQLLTLRPSHPQGKIIFTVDGTLPTLEVGTLYTQPLRLGTEPQVTIVRAIEVVAGLPGPVTNASYSVGLLGGLPLVSLVIEPDALWDVERGIFTNSWERGGEWERPAHVTYLEPDGELGFAVPAGLRVHGTEPLDAPKQSFRLYFRSEYGLARLAYPLYADHPAYSEATQSYKRLLLQAGDRTARWVLFRDQLVGEAVEAWGLRAAQGHFVHLFINGQSWGIYRLSERVERFFLEDNYGIRNADLVQDGRQREGSDAEWEALVDWVKAHDLVDPANYAHLQTRLDLDNFTDFAALYLYFGFSSEELYAVQPRGGRWTFIWGGGSQSYAQRADSAVAVLLEADTDFALLLRRLLENRHYRGRFVGRLADLLNTICLERPMQQRVERLADDLAADMQYETARWPAPLPWEKNVTALRSFVVERPAEVRRQLAELLNLPGTVRISLNVSPSESGELFVNGTSTRAEEWTGDFFPGTAIDVVAIPAPGYVFAGWEREEETTEENLTEVTFTIESPLTAVAHFEPEPDDEITLRPDDVVINEYWINDNGTRYTSLQQRPLEGDWLELWVRRPDLVDLRGWRITDNDTQTGRDEGSIILPQLKSLAAVPRDTVLLIIVSQNTLNDTYFPVDDLDAADGRLLFYLGNGNLDVTTDPGFAIGTGNDNLVLLAPGPSRDFADDMGVDFIAEGCTVTPYTFGVLSDGVRFEHPFRRLGGDDGAFFTRRTGNDSLQDWTVDPPAYQSGDAFRLNSTNLLTPGQLNPQQQSQFPALPWGLAGIALLSALLIYLGRHRKADW